MTVSTRPIITAIAIAVCTALFTSSLRFAPMYCDIITPAPTDAPWLNAISRLTIEPVEPTAARASLPTQFPTIIESTVLYNCCKRLPSISGTENISSFFQIEPSVIRTVPDFFFSFISTLKLNFLSSSINIILI